MSGVFQCYTNLCTSWFVTVSLAGARVPIASYVCTQPRQSFHNDTCKVINGVHTCETKEGGSPTLLDGDTVGTIGVYIWSGINTPFVVLNIPQGWCDVMTFQANVPTLSPSVHT